MERVKMRYSLWKKFYSEFHASDYDAKTKTINVILPYKPSHKMPKEWRREGNYYYTPNGCSVCFWGNGLERSYYVEKDGKSQTIYQGIDCIDRLFNAVSKF